MKKVHIIFYLFFISLSNLFISCSSFSNSSEDYFKVIAVKFRNQDSKISLIDNQGNILIEDEFPSNSLITPVGNMIHEVTSDGYTKYWKLEDKKVKQIGEDQYSEGTPFFNKYAIVRDENGMLSLIDSDGKEVIPNLSKISGQTIVRVGIVSDGLMRFKNDEGLWGYIDLKGQIKIKPKYKSCENFVDGKARVIDNDGSFCIIDKEAKILFTGKNRQTYASIIGDFIPYKEEDGKFWGLMNLKGEKVIKDIKFTSIMPTSNDKLAVSISDKEWGVIDLKGEYLGDLRAKFENNPLFASSGEIILNEDKKVKIFDKNGNIIKQLDDYEYIFPIGNDNYIAQQANKKLIIINEEGKELSKDDFEIAYSSFTNIFQAGGTTSEAIEILKNRFTIQSNYFEFDPIFNKVFMKIDENGSFGLNMKSTISDVMKIFPYYQSDQNQSSNLRFITKSDDYSNFMQHKSNSAKADRSVISSESAVDSAVTSADTTAVSAYSSQINDEYPFIYTYDQSYRPQTRNIAGITTNFSFQFDQILKQEKIGIDPIFTDQTMIIGYGLNNSAKLQSISVSFNFTDIDPKIFWAELEKKAKGQGFIVSGAGQMYHKTNPSRKIVYGGSDFSYIF
jgi:hypothetical protein